MRGPGSWVTADAAFGLMPPYAGVVAFAGLWRMRPLALCRPTRVLWHASGRSTV